ncbi:MAG: efflux RND transporter periplasmic adaptor subunit [Nitrospirae bacterium]|nr:efflux RND transporter periplasmic adaptor subunit [Nitrospirota bacterium]
MCLPIAVYAQQDHSAHGGGQAPQAETVTSDEAPAVEIDSDQQQMIGVRVTEATVKSIRKTIRTVGRIEYDERRLSTVNIKFEGWIEKLYINSTGRPVKKGEPLAEIYSPELYATQMEYLNLVKWATPSNPTLTKGGQGEVSDLLSSDALKLVDAARHRLKLWDISDEQIDKIRETGKPFRTLTLYSPSNGVVIEKMAVEGMRVMPGEKLFDIADLSRLWVLADIFEYELPFVKTGQKAKITLSSFPEKEFESVINFIYPSIAGATRTATVRFEIPNDKGDLKPQMFTNVEIKIDAGIKLVIPDDAIIDTGKRQVVYVDKGEGLFEPREIMTGVKADGFTEVLMGLKPGEKVASSATFLIDSEAQLKGISPLKMDH